MELLAGAQNASTLAQLDRLIASMSLLPFEPSTDFADAAQLYRTCRSHGVTVRKIMDCLIASVAMRHGAAVWHKDADFEAIASIAALETVDLR
jgi:predicted nucleic acid-binding protein